MQSWGVGGCCLGKMLLEKSHLENWPYMGKRAEARLVVIGLEDPQVATVENDAPTLIKDGIVLQQVSNHRWPLLSFDISTAFLHGEGDGRNLGLHPAPEIREAQRISALSMEERTVAAMRRICGTAKSEMS